MLLLFWRIIIIIILKDPDCATRDRFIFYFCISILYLFVSNYMHCIILFSNHFSLSSASIGFASVLLRANFSVIDFLFFYAAIVKHTSSDLLNKKNEFNSIFSKISLYLQFFVN